jgi:hypothetical protein
MDALNNRGESAVHRMVQFDVRACATRCMRVRMLLMLEMQYCADRKNFREVLERVGFHRIGTVSSSGHTPLQVL